MMDNLFELIQRADNGDPEAQYRVASYIVWENSNEPIEPDWLERAVDYFRRSAAQGHGDAMLDFGAMYDYGRGVNKDESVAIDWYRKAAEILHPKAFRCLGYSQGFHNFRDGGYADYKTAFKYFVKGALLGEQNCIYELGDMYYHGRYVEPDQVFAFKLYQKSDSIIDGNIHDDSYANVRLRIGEYGYRWHENDSSSGIFREYIQDAIKGFELRIERGDPPEFFKSDYIKAKRLLNEIESGKWGVNITCQTDDKDDSNFNKFIESDFLNYKEPKYPIAELAELKLENPIIEQFDATPHFNDALAAAESGDRDSMYHIAFYCFNRYDYDSKSKSQAMIEFALYYYHKAVRSGCREAMFNLGDIYYQGTGGVQIDKEKAFLLYSFTNAQIAWGDLGVFYAKGEIVEKDYEMAFKYFSKYALTGEIASYCSLANLATMYRKGLFVDVDDKFADFCDSESKRFEEAWNVEYEKE